MDDIVPLPVEDFLNSMKRLFIILLIIGVVFAVVATVTIFAILSLFL